jgi:hypothetical protein
MKHQLGKIRVQDTEKALREAEARLERPEVTDGKPVFEQLRPQEIRTRLELFQPRRPGYGTKELNTNHVKKLKAKIERKGELNPVLVVKLKGFNPYTRAADTPEWIVVDGHHRIAAYGKAKHTDPIRCEWFAGTVREAMDESMRRNEITHLEVDQGDKAEAAWLRTLLDWDGDDWASSKRYVVDLTGSGEGTVAKMRRAVRWHANYAKGDRANAADRLQGEKLHAKLGADLRAHTWSKVNGVLLDLSPKQWDTNEAAVRLARNLATRMTNKLSEDAEVTARALWLYDPELCAKLIGPLQEHVTADALEAAHEKQEAAE